MSTGRGRRLARQIVATVVALGLAAGLLLAPLPWRVTRSVVSAVDLPRSPDEVFRFVSTPAFWPRWHPSSLGVSGDVDHPQRLGEQAVEHYRVAGREGTAVWTVTEVETDRRWTIVGRIGGRVAGQVSYRLLAAPGGTHFERAFDYYPPNLLFVLLDRLGLHAAIDDESQRAVEQLRRVLAG